VVAVAALVGIATIWFLRAGPGAEADADVDPGKTPTQFVGSWRAHGTRLEIKADLAGTETWNAGPCELGFDPSMSLCIGRASVSFTAASDGLIGTITEVTYTTQDGQPFGASEAQASGPQAGERVTLQLIDVDVLQVTVESPGRQGNSYLCGPEAAETWRLTCNV
jgi:hypothetical protein